MKIVSPIAIGDFISNSINVKGGVFEAVTNVSHTTVLQKDVVHITTASEVIVDNSENVSLSTTNAQGISYFIINQN